MHETNMNERIIRYLTLSTHATASAGISYTPGRSSIISDVILYRGNFAAIVIMKVIRQR